jgi:hypothetical protein
MRRMKLGIAVALLGVVMTVSAVAVAGGGGKSKAKLSGFEEVPAIVTTGKGKLKLKINKSAQTIDYKLSYEDLEGGAVSAAHIHVAQKSVNGPVAAFLCGGGDKPPCPPEGTVTGTIDSGDLVPIPAQGVTEFADLLTAIKAGVTYGNVHTASFGGGEIRGQIRGGDDDSDD